MHRFLILGAIFAGTMMISPANATPDEHRDKRYYDRDGHDYHTGTTRKIAPIAFIWTSIIALIASSKTLKPPSSTNISSGGTIIRITSFFKLEIK